MPAHIHEDHINSDHFDFDGETLSAKGRARGGASLTSTVTTNPASAGVDTLVAAAWTGNNNAVEIAIDGGSNGFKYTGTADKQLLVMASMSASIDTNAVEAEWTVYVNGSATSVNMIRYFDKSNKTGSFTLAGRISVKQNEIIQIYVKHDTSGAKIDNQIINIELFEV